MPDLAILGLIAVAVAAVGIAVGMLAAPRLIRWSERDEEADGHDG
jgi:hypothetical protein